VAPTAAGARDVMVEGESGLMAICPPRYRPVYYPSTRRLIWPNGALATLYSADEPERLRGPQHEAAWADEVASQGTRKTGNPAPLQISPATPIC
jgi:phage terminase large subunit-like protein